MFYFIYVDKIGNEKNEFRENKQWWQTWVLFLLFTQKALSYPYLSICLSRNDKDIEWKQWNKDRK